LITSQDQLSMEIWIVLSLAAALFQTLRFMLQKKMAQVTLSASGATFARFVYSAPLAVLAAAILLLNIAEPVALPGAQFWGFAVAGGTAQILATVCTVLLFGRRNLAVGMAFIKVEVLLTLLLGWIVLGEPATPVALAAIFAGVAGLLVLSGAIKEAAHWGGRFFTPSAALGLAAGALFGISAVSYRGATLEIGLADPFQRAILTLAVVTSLQLLAMALWLGWRDRPQIGKVLSAWRSASWIGMTSLAGSFFWFTAFTLQNAAWVKAVGQVEVIFGIIASVLFFRESISRREYFGIALISLSILALILLG
jgi:drug/metabolite transporter (DMT)-like permease